MHERHSSVSMVPSDRIAPGRQSRLHTLQDSQKARLLGGDMRWLPKIVSPPPSGQI